MGKDKPATGLTMQDMAHTLKERGRKSPILIPDSTIFTGNAGISNHDEKARVAYNRNIRNWSEEYANFKPYNRVIVRCYVMEYEYRNGIMIAPAMKVPVKTANGMTFKQYDDSPWPYSRRAIVVAVPEGYTKYSAGQEVLLDRHVVLCTKENVEADFYHPHGFTVDSWYDFEPPKDMASEHFGYLIVSPQAEILGELSDLKTKDNARP